MKKLQIADLKRVCEKPEVVEIWDTTAQDPEFLVYIKASRNAVPVPRHWSQKRAFLAGKRGMEKPPFKLPAFIEATGIAKLRDSYAERGAEIVEIESERHENREIRSDRHRLSSHARCIF